jgi:hypothetical protein
MKMLPATACAAVLLIGCNAAKAESPQLLALDRDADNRLISQIEYRNPGTLCSLVPADGQARLMSYGNEAVADLGGVPVLLTYHPDKAGDRAEFNGKGIRIAGKLIRESVTRPYATVSHDVSVEVEAEGHTENFKAAWTCQAKLLTVRVIH